jgi:hypothetical protein
MASSRVKIAVMILAALAFSTAVRAQDAWGLPDFSATQISQAPGTAPQMGPLRIYKSGMRYRTEPDPGQVVIWVPARGILVGIELGRVCCRRRVTTLTLSVARWVRSSAMATFSEAPL